MKVHFLPHGQRPAAAPSPHHLPCQWSPPLPPRRARGVGGRPAAAGFPLVELMVVIVIIGLLATLVMIHVMHSPHRALNWKARARGSTPEHVVETYQPKHPLHPTTNNGHDPHP